MPSKNGRLSRWICPFDQYYPESAEEMVCLKSGTPYVFSKKWRDEECFGGILRDLKFYGCTPCIRLVSGKWRFYVNNNTNMHEESTDLRTAFRKAFRKWEKEKRPTDEGKHVSLQVREHKQGKRVWRHLQWRIA